MLLSFYQYYYEYLLTLEDPSVGWMSRISHEEPTTQYVLLVYISEYLHHLEWRSIPTTYYSSCWNWRRNEEVRLPSCCFLVLPPLVVSIRWWRALYVVFPSLLYVLLLRPRRVSSSLSSPTIMDAIPFIFVRVTHPVARIWWMGSSERKVHLLFWQHEGTRRWQHRGGGVRCHTGFLGPPSRRKDPTFERPSETGAPRPDPSIEHTRNNHLSPGSFLFRVVFVIFLLITPKIANSKGLYFTKLACQATPPARGVKKRHTSS